MDPKTPEDICLIRCPQCNKEISNPEGRSRKRVLGGHQPFCYTRRYPHGQSFGFCNDFFDERNGIIVENEDSEIQSNNNSEIESTDETTLVVQNPEAKRQKQLGADTQAIEHRNNLPTNLEPGTVTNGNDMVVEDSIRNSREETGVQNLQGSELLRNRAMEYLDRANEVENFVNRYDVFEHLLYDVEKYTKEECTEAGILSNDLNQMFLSQARNENLDSSTHDEWDKIVSDYNLSILCQQRILSWVHKHINPQGVSVQKIIKESRQTAKIKVPTISIRKREIKFGVGLSNDGYQYSIYYKEPLLTIARSVTQILHRYGEETFQITTGTATEENYEFAQDARFLQGVQKVFSDQVNALIIPIRIHVDGAHMRRNGLHNITPVMISIVHRMMYAGDDSLTPELISIIPDIKRVLALRQKKTVASMTAQLNSALHHSVLKNLFASFPVVWNQKSFHVHYKDKRILCFPVVFKMCMDMPMVSLCSFVKASRPMEQLFPCQQCLAKGKRDDYYLSAEAVRYRSEETMLRFVAKKHEFKTEREMYNLRYIGKPSFGGMNPFDAHGIFLLTAGDGLHAFKGIWFRGVLTVCINLVYTRSQTPEDRAARVGLMAVHDVAARTGQILGTARGLSMIRIAEKILDESTTRKGCERVHIRRRNPFDQATLMQEHKYSLGMLLQVIVVIGCNTSEELLGCEWRKLWLRVACLSVVVYSLLFRRQQNSGTLRETATRIEQLLHAVQEMKAETGYVWNAPKLHLLIHFPDMIRQFGRMRIFDTVDGESAVKEVKEAYEKICHRDTWNPCVPLLQKAEAAKVTNFNVELSRHVDVGNSSSSATVMGKQMRLSSSTLKRLRNAEKVRLCYSKGQVSLESEIPERIDSYPLKLEGSREKLWKSICKALELYIVETFDEIPEEGTIILEHRKTAVLRFMSPCSLELSQQTAAASYSSYSRPRYDFVEFRDTQDGTAYGQLVALAKASIDLMWASDDKRYANEKCIAFINPLRACEENSCPHLDLHEVYNHQKLQLFQSNQRILRCVPVANLMRRVTAFIQEGLQKHTIHASSLEGQWYFILKPQLFESVEVYT